MENLALTNEQIKEELGALQLGNKFSVPMDMPYYVRKSIMDDLPEIWRKFFPAISPKALFDKLSAGASFPVTLSIGDVEEEKDRYSFKIIYGAPGIFENNLTFKNIIDDPAAIEFARADFYPPGQGYGKQHLGMIVDIFKEQGIKQLSVITIQQGCYAWAKYGFRPSADDWERLKLKIKERISEDEITYEGEQQDLSFRVTNALRKSVNAILQSPDPADIIKFTALEKPVGKDFENTVTIGKALLQNTEWAGILPLDDNDIGYQQFKSYTASGQKKERGAP